MLCSFQIKTKKGNIDQNLIDRLSSGSATIRNLNSRLDTLQHKKSNDTQDVDSQITLIPTDQHSGPQLAKFESQIGRTEHTVTIDKQVAHFDKLIVDELIAENINHRPVDNLVYSDRPINAQTLKVGQLHVKSREQLNKITSAMDDLTAVEAKRNVEHIVYPDHVDEIVADQLIVDGAINGINLAMIQKFALRVNLELVQKITAQINFIQLITNQVEIVEEAASRHQLRDLIRTVDGPYTVLQDVSFERPLMVNSLFIDEQLNHIGVNETGQFEILLKRSSEVQTISGLKQFKAVKLRNPISLRGQISLPNLDHMNPVVTMTNDIVLEGDYVISGNVTVKRALKCNDMFGSSGTFSARYLMDEGLMINDTEVATSLVFAQPIKTRELRVMTLNDVVAGDFAESGKIQEVTGRKTFTGDLHIFEGVCEASIINGVDLKLLNKTVLTKTGDQTIKGNIQFRKISLQQYVEL